MRGKKAILGIALAAVAALGAAPAAQAEESSVAAAPICQAAYVGTQYIASFCFESTFGVQSVATVGGTLRGGACVYDPAICRPPAPVTVGKTGFEPNTRIPAPRVYPGAVYWPGGTVGTLWVDGTPSYVYAAALCIGNPLYCP